MHVLPQDTFAMLKLTFKRLQCTPDLLPSDVTAASFRTANPKWAQDVIRETGTAPRFADGDPVRTRNVHPTGHTRKASNAAYRARTG